MTVTGVIFNARSSVAFAHSFVDIKPTVPACGQTMKDGFYCACPPPHYEVKICSLSD